LPEEKPLERVAPLEISAELVKGYAAGNVGGFPGIAVAVCAKPSLFVKRRESPTASIVTSGA
jgi:allophanate hydrolase subunit 1